MAGQPRNARDGFGFEPRSITLTLQQLADKTPADEPLLVTMREYREYLKFQQSRAIEPESPGLVGGSFNGRRLFVIPEPTQPGTYAAVERSKEPLFRPTREQIRVVDGGNAMFVGEDAKPAEASPYTPIMQSKVLSRVNGLNLQAFVNGIAESAPAQAKESEQAFKNFIQQRLNELEAQQQREQLGSLAAENDAVYRSGLNQREELTAADWQKYAQGELTAEIIARLTGADELATGVAQDRAMPRTRPRNGGAVRTPPPARTTERNIPVGQTRGYFEE